MIENLAGSPVADAVQPAIALVLGQLLYVFQDVIDRFEVQFPPPRDLGRVDWRRVRHIRNHIVLAHPAEKLPRNRLPLIKQNRGIAWTPAFATISAMAKQLATSDFYDLDQLLSPAELAVRDAVRTFVDERYLPVVNQHWHAGTFPMELVPEMGRINCFGATIKGYGCAGLSNLAYGLVMGELERGDSGLRTVASVQVVLAMNAIYYFGSEDQKQRWLPEMAKGGKELGCFLDIGPKAISAQPCWNAEIARRTRMAGRSTARRRGSATATSPMSRSSGRDRCGWERQRWVGVICGFLVEKDTPVRGRV